MLGFRYRPGVGKARVGQNCMLRKGTIIYGDVRIGDYFQSGHYSVIRALVKIGNYCTLSNHSTIEGIVRLGDGVRIMSHTFVPARTCIGDLVFIGPGTNYLHDRLPLRREPASTNVRGATIHNEVMIGGGVTILPEIEIGERSFVAAGAVVTKDVPPRSMVIGVPGRIYPLPKELDRDNDRHTTVQKTDLWHPMRKEPRHNVWPEYWPDGFED